MKKTFLITAIGLASLLALFLTETSFAQQRSSRRRVIVGFKDGTGQGAAERRRTLIRERGGAVRHSYRSLPAAAAELSEIQISRLRSDPSVAYVEEDGLVYALDAELDSSWGVKRIGAGSVHSSGNRGAGIKVAIIDTGIDYTHPDLDDNYAGGKDFVNDDDDPRDDNGHGTHCAGIVAARDDGVGTVGVAPEASLYGVKVLDSTGSGYLSDVAAGIDWAIDNEMDVISMSLGTNSNYQTLLDACDRADAAGIVVVAAAGNDYRIRRGIESNTVDYPARYDSVIAVGSITAADTKAGSSSTGPTVELAAPGVSVRSTYLGGGYAYMSGTSMACPHVAGVAALILAGPSGDVRATLQATANDLGNPGRDNWYGYGLVDADEAAPAPAGPPSAEFMGDTTSGDAPLIVNFLDLSTGNTTSWSWDFGDGGSSTLQDPSHEYQNPGTYTVSLTATGPGGSDDEIKAGYITVATPVPPVAAFSGNPMSGDAPLTVNFTDLSTDATSWSWDFGDGGSSTQQDPSHEYQNPGTYTVTLTATGPGGSDDEIKADYITVAAPPPPPAPVADFSGTPTGGDAPLTVNFTDLSTDATSWSWDFGDGVSSTQQYPSHEYQDPGTYTVSLTATGPGGSNIETKDNYITVTTPPPPPGGGELTVFSDSFESSADWSSNWSQDGQNDWRRRTARPYDGSYSAEVDGRATNAQLISTAIDLQGRTDAVITFWWFIERGLDNGEYLAFDVSTDGGSSWTEKAWLNGNVDIENTWHPVEVVLNGISSVRLRFRGTMSDSAEDAYVDMVEVIAQ